MFPPVTRDVRVLMINQINLSSGASWDYIIHERRIGLMSEKKICGCGCMLKDKEKESKKETEKKSK